MRKISKKLPKRHMAEFLFSLHSFLEAGISIAEALSIMKESKIKGPAPSFEEKIAEEVFRGVSFAQAFAEAGRAPRLLVSILSIGEARGSLADAVQQAALYIEKSQAGTQAIVGALIYPAIIFMGLFGLVCALMTFIMPALIPVFTSMHVALPLPTRLTIGLWKTLTTHLILIVSSLILIATSAVFIYKISERTRVFFERLVLQRIPFISSIVRLRVSTRFFSIIALTLESGSGLYDSLLIAGESFAMLTLKQAFADMAKKISAGGRFSAALGHAKIIFPPQTAHLIRVAEETGTLAKTASRLSTRDERIVESKMSLFTRLLEPALMIVIACFVGFVAVSIITPMYSLTSSLNAR